MTLLVSHSPTGFLPGNLAITEDLKRPEVCVIAARTTAGKLERLVQALWEVVVKPPPLTRQE